MSQRPDPLTGLPLPRRELRVFNQGGGSSQGSSITRVATPSDVATTSLEVDDAGALWYWANGNRYMIAGTLSNPIIVGNFGLLEDGSFILLETGDKLLLET